MPNVALREGDGSVFIGEPDVLTFLHDFKAF